MNEQFSAFTQTFFHFMPNFSIVLTDCSNVNECRSSSGWPDYEAEHIEFGIESLVVHNVPSSTDVVERRRKKTLPDRHRVTRPDGVGSATYISAAKYFMKLHNERTQLTEGDRGGRAPTMVRWSGGPSPAPRSPRPAR